MRALGCGLRAGGGALTVAAGARGVRPVEVDGHQLQRLATTTVALSRCLEEVSTPVLLAARGRWRRQG